MAVYVWDGTERGGLWEPLTDHSMEDIYPMLLVIFN